MFCYYTSWSSYHLSASLLDKDGEFIIEKNLIGHYISWLYGWPILCCTNSERTEKVCIRLWFLWDQNIMSRGCHWGTVVRGKSGTICEEYCSYLCGVWGIQILRGCRCSDSGGTGTAVGICTDCAGNSCHLQRTGDQFDVSSSICMANSHNTQEGVS